MKNFIKFTLITAILAVSNQSFADEKSSAGSASCFLVKNNKIVAKDICTYKVDGDYNNGGFFEDITIKMKKMKKTYTISGSGAWSFGEPEFTLNGKVTTKTLRIKSNLKQPSQQQLEKLFGTKDLLSCLKDTSTNQEICFISQEVGQL